MKTEESLPGVKQFNRLIQFIRAVNHSIRTPLSVVSNELFYFKSLLPAQEIERAEARCAEIAGILDRTKFCGTTELCFEEVPASELINDAVAALGIRAPAVPSCMLYADRSRLAGAIRQLLVLLCVECADGSVVYPGLKTAINDGFFNLHLEARHNAKVSGMSLVQILQSIRGQDAFEAVLLESLFDAHGIKSRVLPTQHLTIELSMESISL